jgi:hypothetical protein
LGNRKHNEVDRYAGPEADLVNDHLRKVGGDCFMGFPTYRLVYTKKLLDWSGGLWCDWDESIPADERGSLVMGMHGSVVPNTREMRQIAEMRRVEKYPEFFHTPGWVMERWMAPAYWGAPEAWERHVVAGTDIPMLGPFPHQGRYMIIGGPYPEKPTGQFLERLIEHWEAMRDEVLALEAATYVRKRVFEAEERHAEKEEKWTRDAHSANMAVLAPFFSTSLEAGRARQLAVEHSGIHSHYGN